MIMKKFFFFAAIAAIGLASCSNDETIASQATSESNAISFRPLATSLTRSADITTTNLSSFWVTANLIAGSSVTNYFGGETPVQFSDANIGTGDGQHASTAGTYTSATKYYWPSSGKLDFIAFAPATGTDITTRTDSTHFSVTPNATPSAQQDFLYAVVRNQTKAANGTGVVLNFRHALSKVIIKLKNSSTDLHFTVKDVAIGNILPTGAFAPVYYLTDQIGFCTNNESAKSNTTIASESGYYITGAAWTPSGTAREYKQTAGTTAYAVNTSEAVALSHDMILIPQGLTAQTGYETAAGDNNGKFLGAYISVELKIQDAQNHYIVGSGEDYVTAMWPLAALTWLPGHRYTYTVDLIGGGYYPTDQNDDGTLDPILDNSEIKFVNVTIDNWIDATGIDVPAGS